MGYLIFCVDDDIDDCELLTEVMKQSIPETELIFASGGIEAVEKLDELLKDNVKPAMIIIDLNLPGLDAKSTLKEINSKQGLLEVPKLILSTSPPQEDINYFAKYGVPVMKKPSTILGYETVVETIKKSIISGN